MAYVITQSCCNDASCVAVCPVDAIHPRPDEREFRTAEMLYIDPRTCIDCGACARSCPVSAIYPEDDLPPQLSEYGSINADYFAARAPALAAPANGSTFTVTTAARDRLRVAIVGSGPAGAYTAAELLARRDIHVDVDMYDRLFTPWGLVRSGVAPDHTTTKAIIGQFEKVANHPRFRFRLGVEIGADLTHEELATHYHAVIYAVGARAHRSLGIPGEDLPGCHAAIDFVAWYNGHPDHADDTYDLAGSRAVVIGNGNVALDVARILLAEPDELARTDIAPQALKALRASTITEVVVVGRRGPDQAAYTEPELRAWAHLPGISVTVEGSDALSGPLAAMNSRPDQGGKRLVLRFLAAPASVLGRDRASGVRITVMEPKPGPGGEIIALPTTHTEDIPASLILRATGQRGAPIPGIPFDEAAGTIPTVAGRVLSLSERAPVAGTYATGWIKRGATGAIGTNKQCAAETVASLLHDYGAGLLPANPLPSQQLDAILDDRGVSALGLDGWRRIDVHERTAGENTGSVRRKLTKVAAQRAVAMARGRHQ